MSKLGLVLVWHVLLLFSKPATSADRVDPMCAKFIYASLTELKAEADSSGVQFDEAFREVDEVTCLKTREAYIVKLVTDRGANDGEHYFRFNYQSEKLLEKWTFGAGWIDLGFQKEEEARINRQKLDRH